MKNVLYLIAILVVLVGLIAAFGPREPVDGPVTFDASKMGDNLDNYLYQEESDIPDLVRGSQKHIIWADPGRREKTEYSIVYVHGFSATSYEIRPVPELVADDLGANIFYTRLKGHGRDGAAMLDGSVPAWRDDMREALEIGRRIGNRVVVIATSTGATLATLALQDEAERQGIYGLIFVSPNFALRDTFAPVLEWPFARTIAPMISGKERVVGPRNSEQAKRWTLRYPTEALAPLGALLRAVKGVEYEKIDIPTLFVFSDEDTVVSAARTRTVAARWGGDVSLYPLQLQDGDDPSSHVIAGDIMSPRQTKWVARQMIDWILNL